MQKHIRGKDQRHLDFGPCEPFYTVEQLATAEHGRNAEYELDAPEFYETCATDSDYIDARSARRDHETIRKLPPPRTTLHVVATGKTSGWQMIEHLRTLAAQPIRSLWISTLSMSLANVEALTASLDAGTIGRVSLIASCYFKSTNDEIWHRVYSDLTARGQSVAGIRCHAKVSVLQFSARRWFTIETSANLRSSGNIEQYTITQSEPLGRFHANWIDASIRDAHRYQ